MSIFKTATASGSFSPDDLQPLQKVFDEICAERGLPQNSVEAKTLAIDIMMLFHNGIVDEEELRSELEKRSNPPREI